ncbi:hypothetical protein CC86DRAFT_343724 [Ophiobolus disseminans]|uniref:DUF6536 domain-containing protein n=1 Tax=Ophiobolus disseminans TaxID=1469910 RepID=A0A6A7ACY5_9PLEO|nr:hypothetical protein CC86DRAFT_343724 [Ophiobolus disseminans]
MRLPQRFKRLPGEDPQQQEGITMSTYPSKPKLDVNESSTASFLNDARPKHSDTEYSAARYNTTGYIISHRKTLVERVEEYELRRFGTKAFGTFYDTFVGGWRAGLVRSFLLSLVALIVNISVYTWLFRTYDATTGTATLRRGHCGIIRNANTGIHAALNVVSTLILGASTYAMQGITAPTRKEVDAAHAKGKWVEIGTPSLRNLLYVRRRNTWVWLLLAITSMPFHLFFNAVFFTTTQANQYAVAVVEESILSNTPFRPTIDNSSPDLFEQWLTSKEDCDGDVCTFDLHDNSTVIELLQDITNSSNMAGFERMEPLACIQNYTSGFMRGYGDVVVVSSRVGSESPVLYSRFPQSSVTTDKEDTNQDPYHWICRDIITSNDFGDGKDGRCSVDMAIDRTDAGKNWTVYSQPVSYCLARVVPDTCELQFNQWLMLGVVLCGGVKTIVIAYLLIWRPKGQFLRTLGDAISSFLEREDTTTNDMCLVSSKQIRKHGFKEPFEPQTFTGIRPRWFSSANTTEFYSTIGVSAFLGTPDIQSMASFKPDDTGSSGIVPTLLIANVPQLGFSLLYVVYTNIWGKLMVAHEFDRLTQARKGLRVSERPKGMQRRSHFFTLPARYALPLMGCSAALHWLCSQSFFMVRIDGVNSRGVIDTDDQLVRLGYSATGVVSLIGVSIAMLVATVCIGSFRRLGTGLHETSMSAVISAACHPGRYESEPWLQEVQWGDVSEDIASEEGYVAHNVKHISFTARLAKQPIQGQAYV